MFTIRVALPVLCVSMRVLSLLLTIGFGAALTLLLMNSSAQPKATAPTEIEIVHVNHQPWYTAEDKAVAREIASPRNSRAQQLSIADIIIPAGVTVKPHYHKVIEEIYFVSEGSGVMLLNGAERKVTKGDAVVIRPGERHSIRNDTTNELRLIVTCNPPWTPDCMVFD